MACPNACKTALVNDGLYRRHSRVDQRLEDRIDQSADRLAFPRRSNGDEWSLPLMWLDQDQHAIWPQVVPRSLEGMDHALDCDSSKRPAEERDLERVAPEAQPFGGVDTEGDVADAF
jgi:hypothetical protein